LRQVVKAAQEKSVEYPNMMIIEPPLDALHWADETQIVACGGVKEELTIMPNGNITFCEPLGNNSAFVFGNITANTLYEIWNSHVPDFICRIPADAMDEVCCNCAYLDACHTGCFLFSYRDFKNPFAVDPRCFHAREPAV
jgi:pyrroloquinoline quinone biosynthesis protein E